MKSYLRNRAGELAAILIGTVLAIVVFALAGPLYLQLFPTGW